MARETGLQIREGGQVHGKFGERFVPLLGLDQFDHMIVDRRAIAQAWGVIQRLSGDAEARRLAEYEEIARWDDVGRYEGAFKNGEMKGRQEGIYSVAENLLRMKMPVDDIVKATGLPFDEVKQLAANFTG
jgi:predicted transposase/invertase (TIGR01784 family)